MLCATFTDWPTIEEIVAGFADYWVGWKHTITAMEGIPRYRS